jgi:hypothetical protein
MAHKVRFSIPERELGKADIEFSVQKDGVEFGRLRISKGAVVWLPKHFKYGYRVSWAKFDQLMRDNGIDESK